MKSKADSLANGLFSAFINGNPAFGSVVAKQADKFGSKRNDGRTIGGFSFSGKKGKILRGDSQEFFICQETVNFEGNTVCGPNLVGVTIKSFGD